ncbi:MAG: amidohydrolase [Firmicutes bacterium]|nr:amidohydrolase [Bacillota bacterium]
MAVVTEEELIGWRRHLHLHPELSFAEHETANFIAQELANMGLAPVRIANTGVYADVVGRTPRPMVAVRADIDALPLTEQTGLPYASQNEGVMHACGHDGHTAIALAVAKELTSARALFDGTVRVLFQPAEEHPPGGAVAMIANGVLDGVEEIIGLHLWTPVATGIAAISPGPVTANSDFFEIHVQGRGGHGAMPHETVDAVMAATDICQALQKIVSRRVDPIDPVVITVGSLHAGTSHNIVADEAVLKGTVRTAHDFTRDFVEAEMERVCAAIGGLSGATCTLQYTRGYPAVVNAPHASAVFADVCAQVLGADAVQGMKQLMIGEDFSYYLQQRPGAFLFLGVGDEGKRTQFPHHHPRFAIDEDMLMKGAQILRLTALQLLDEASAQR